MEVFICSIQLTITDFLKSKQRRSSTSSTEKKFKSLFGRFSLTAYLEYCISQGRDLDSYIIVLQATARNFFVAKKYKEENFSPFTSYWKKKTTKPIKVQNLINWREILEVMSSFSNVYISVLKPWKCNILLWPLWNPFFHWYPRVRTKKVLQFYQWSSTIVLLKTGNGNLIRSSTDTQPCQSYFKI